ncbi:MAG: hypothetical protein NDJ90_01795 [Oligoflexia bacterium]|nr:hypothetical protein [Oligoflexia bacterium]
MPGVTPSSDGGYNYYQKALNDLEEELRTEARRSRERQSEQTRKLEEAHQQTLDKYRKETDETVNHIRRNANDTIEQDRRTSKAEIDRIKAQTYDKFGRFNGLEADALQSQLEELQRASAEQHQKDRGDLAASDEHHSQRMNELQEENNRELERNARATRDSVAGRQSAAYQTQAEEHTAFRAEAEKKLNEVIRGYQEELQKERKFMQRALEQERRNFNNRLETAQESNDERVKQLENIYSAKMQKGARTFAESTQGETRRLREQLDELNEARRSYHREKGEGAEEAVREHDADWRAKLRSASEDFNRQLEHTKHGAKQEESHLASLNKESLREKDAYFTDVIAKANQENHEQRKELEEGLVRDRKQMELQQKRERETTRKTAESRLDEANQQRDTALKEQAKAFQDTLERQRTSDEDKIRALQKSLNTRATSEDTTDISPAAEAAVRRSVTREYEKLMTAERDRNQAGTDSLKRSYTDRLNEAVRDKESTTTDLQRRFMSEKTTEQNRFVSHIQDTEFLKAEALRNKDSEANRQTENLNRNYASLLEKMRREYEEIFEAQKADSSHKLIATRQEAEFNAKLAQREYTARHNETIRDSNRKLADQKQEYELLLEELKSKNELQLRDAERRTKLAVEEEKRTADQKLAQAEQQHKERERYLTENFEEQLEKVKRSNALLIQKKG